MARHRARRRRSATTLGYVLLDYDDEFAIDAVAIYLSHQALLVRFELEPLLQTLTESNNVSLPALRESFRDAVFTTRKLDV